MRMLLNKIGAKWFRLVSLFVSGATPDHAFTLVQQARSGKPA
jgi:hypothetical protein